MSEINPIADLSYRNYDGPLRPPTLLWWTIAKNTMRQSARNKFLWFMSILAGIYYFIMMIVLFVFDRIAASGPAGVQAQKAFLGRLEWNEQFLHGLGYAQMPSMIIAILVGAGAIANDNRANALLVYLSKPVSRFDYAFGKWVGVFLFLLGALAVPSLAFYGYGILTFREMGFLKQDPYLITKLFALLPLCAALNTSLVLAISSVFKQGRIAGAVYAGVYFLGYFFTVAMGVAWQLSQQPRFDSTPGEGSPLIKTLYYCSIDGLQLGLGKAILGARGVGQFGFPNPGRMAPPPPAPSLVPCLLVVLAVALVSLAITWKRVRAVEVVG